MLLYMLTLFDFVCALCILLSPIIPGEWIFMPGLFMVAKGVIFGLSGNFLSWIDFAIGLYMLLLVIGVSWTLLTVVSFLYLAQKVVVAFIS